jgi:hypothetical protein
MVQQDEYFIETRKNNFYDECVTKSLVYIRAIL